MFRPVFNDDFHPELRRNRMTVEASILATVYSSVEVLCVTSHGATRTDFDLFYDDDDDDKASIPEQLYGSCIKRCIENKPVF